MRYKYAQCKILKRLLWLHSLRGPQASTNLLTHSCNPCSGKACSSDGSTICVESTQIPSFVSTLLLLILLISERQHVGIMLTIGLGLFLKVLFHPSLLFMIMGLLYTMIWVPQIIRSARRNTMRALSLEYVVGTTLGRAFFPLCGSSFRRSELLIEV